MKVTATASDSFDLGGTGRLHAARWRTWLRWAVLASGLVLLGWMVRRLVRQLGEPKGPCGADRA
jgi:hypothetical protein